MEFPAFPPLVLRCSSGPLSVAPATGNGRTAWTRLCWPRTSDAQAAIIPNAILSEAVNFALHEAFAEPARYSWRHHRAFLGH